MNKIAIIIPYFGKWPEWIDLYFHSCRQNTFIDWFFFTDCDNLVKSENVFFNFISFKEYCEFVSEKLVINFSPTTPYKLCDLKVFYGFLHQDLIQKYEFWGFGDVDLVWGNISAFYTDSLLNRYDVFSTHADRLSGHFSILRNNKVFTEKCFSIDNWAQKLESKAQYGLDEIDFSILLYPQSRYIRRFYGKVLQPICGWRNAWVIYYNLMPIINFLLGIKSRKFYLKEQHTTPILSNDGLSFHFEAESWYYMNGKILNNKTSQEFIYLHFMLFKKNAFRDYYYWKNNFYTLSKSYDFIKGVLINKSGISALD